MQVSDAGDVAQSGPVSSSQTATAAPDAFAEISGPRAMPSLESD
jgi:hypothetical protein